MSNKKRIPTFYDNGKCLEGPAAIEAWESQQVRCACGYPAGTERYTVSGTVGYQMPAEWLGCTNPRHNGQTLGYPLVYRLPSQMPEPTVDEEVTVQEG